MTHTDRAQPTPNHLGANPSAPQSAPAGNPPNFRRPLKAALRSGLRRYPRELLASLRATPTHPALPARDMLEELAPHGLAVAWLGHAGVLATLGKLTLTIDPVLSTRIGMKVANRVFGPARKAPPPIDAESLKGLDAILISHAHYDHLDKPTLAQLADERTTVIVPQRCGKLIPKGFANIIELAPGQPIDFHSATLEALPPRHWGARAWLDRKRGVNAYLLRHEEGSILFTGDTAHTESFNELRDIDLAVFGIGAYDPWEHMHATPEQVWRMFIACGARHLLPVHHSTFELSDEPMHEPLARLRAAAGDDAHRIIEEQQGEVVVVSTKRE